MNLWVELIVKGQKASLDAFATFLRKRATEVTDDNFEESGRNTGGPGPCYCCKNYHKMFHCEFFRSRRVTNRWSMTKKSHLCSNCMQGRHPVRECKSMNNCKICNKRHNTILHVSMEAKAKSRKARRMKAREVKKMAKEEAQGVVKSEAPAQPTGQSTDKAKSKNRWRKKTPNTKKNSNRNTPQEVQQ
uniref:Uncharacterized protein n=1 Tax=Nyssomyia neivai TaxID=330878 RepID=A0A1L8D8F5_9DIPT